MSPKKAKENGAQKNVAAIRYVNHRSIASHRCGLVKFQ